MCLSAVETVQRALAALEARDQLSMRVTPSELLVDDIAVGGGALIGRELAARLHRASAASVTLDRSVSCREMARFCEGLVHCGARGSRADTLFDWLASHGVDRIAVELACRPEVLEVGVMSAEAAATLGRERSRFEAQLARGGAIHHLYPPQKGWVRLDPAQAPPSISLLDLAVLAEDPAALAAMLLRLTDDEGGMTPEEALQQKYSDVAMLITALDPPVARRMFGRLARAVLGMEPARRQALLRRTVLPGLLDGRIDGTILRDFPDVDLAESLCLLLDLETAAPELLTSALARLDLSPERHAAVTPLLEAKLREREEATADGERQTTLARHARELVRIDGSVARSFADFSAFDLSMDDEARAALTAIRAGLPAADMLGDQLTCLWHLVCLEPNPESVGRFLDLAFARFADLERAARGAELPQWLLGFRTLADRVQDLRPDAATAIRGRLAGFVTPSRVLWMADLSARDEAGRRVVQELLEALGPCVAAALPPLVDGAGRGGAREAGETAGRVMRLLTDHAAALAPVLAPLLPTCTPAVCRTLLRVLGAAGSGYEDAIAAFVSASDEGTAREALRALARLGTPKASALVAAQIARQDGVVSAAAEETLWHFPPVEAERRTRELLGRLEFTLSHPQATERLLDRAARAGGGGLEPVLQALAPLRFRIWNPAVARVARKAHRMLQPGL
jgi:hypothetical protein